MLMFLVIEYTSMQAMYKEKPQSKNYSCIFAKWVTCICALTAIKMGHDAYKSTIRESCSFVKMDESYERFISQHGTALECDNMRASLPNWFEISSPADYLVNTDFRVFSTKSEIEELFPESSESKE